VAVGGGESFEDVLQLRVGERKRHVEHVFDSTLVSGWVKGGARSVHKIFGYT
jgi:hypothetical protein